MVAWQGLPPAFCVPTAMTLIDKVRHAIESHGLLSSGDAVVIAVSGGADSMALLDILVALAEELRLRLHVAHLHHGLRPEADEDARFVAERAAALGLARTVERVDVAAQARGHRQSVEEAGRAARYDLFARVASRTGAAAIATAHTRDDQVETVLMRLQQGGPWELLAGMRPRRSAPGAAVIRPLWDVSRAETRAYLRHRGLRWREDPSNLDLTRARNRIRHRDLPALVAIHPGWPDLLWDLGAAVRAAADVLDGLSSRLYGHLRGKDGPSVVIALDALRAQPEALRRRMLRLAAAEVGGTVRPLPRVLEDRMLQAVERGRSGTEIAGAEVLVRVGRGEVVLAPPVAVLLPVAYLLEVPGEVHAEGFGLVFSAALEPRIVPSDDAAEAVLDAGRVRPPLQIRTWRPGDVFRPLGLRGKKKMQDFFVDAKVPRWERRRIPLVLDARGEVIWVVGYRIADPCRVHEGTERVLRLRVCPA